ncbi:MAG: sirohydrochlorin cobaltochelatase [Bacteroidaceae bacterium]|nr:sirohydrochlorin cobaltochelatase [Bacteroidaceae bacterium]
MKKIKFLLVAALAALTFASCSKDEDVKINMVSEYQLNDELVAAQKAKSGNDKAILLVAFGSTWNNAFLAFDDTKAAYEKEFPGYDVYVSFSSDICINRASAGENEDEEGNIVKRDYYEPRYLLHAIGAAKYSEIRVQSLQVIPGEEFAAVVASVKKFANNGYVASAHLDDEYLKHVNIRLGMPLLDNPDVDVPAVAEQLHKTCTLESVDGIVAFMGHGNPDSYDTFKANIRYNQLEEALQELSPNYFVGCVDQPENFKTHVYARMVDAGLTSGKLYLHPLMSIAGDHAHNDMGGDDGEDMDPDEWELNDDGEIEDLSWKVFFSKLGYQTIVPTVNFHPQGLLELPGIRSIWIKHTKEAETLEEAYHSMYPSL